MENAGEPHPRASFTLGTFPNIVLILSYYVIHLNCGEPGEVTEGFRMEK